MISDRLSQNPSIVSFEAFPARESATPKSTEKNTICKTSLFAAASKKLCGTTCSSTPVSVTCF